MEFFCDTRIVGGMGALSSLKSLKSQRLLLVCDPYFANSPWVKEIGSAAEEMAVFSDVTPDPTVETVAEGTKRLQGFAPDTVVALGGGSAMDCAKAMVYFSGLSPRLVAVPTTSGAGSEVTDFAILTHNGVKHPLIDEKLRPHMAILDGELLNSLPPGLVADSGFDVLSHALEALVATGSNPFTDALAEASFAGVFSNLLSSFKGDKTKRPEIHTYATMAGVAFTRAGLGLCHALSHSLGGEFHTPHGRLNSILLPAVVGENAVAAGGKYQNIARRAGLSAGAETVAVRNLKNALCRLRRELDLPESLLQAGISPKALWEKKEKIIEAALADPCCATNPVPVDRAMVQRVLEEVSGGR